MLDLSEESKEDNIKECVHYFKRMAKMGREWDQCRTRHW
jgi:fructose-bisphosphate aldolase class II